MISRFRLLADEDYLEEFLFLFFSFDAIHAKFTVACEFENGITARCSGEDFL